MKKGIMIQTFGRQFAAYINMVSEPYIAVHSDFANEPRRVVNVSPFSICGKYDESLSKYITCERTNTRVKADIYKDFSNIMKKANCDYLVIDNAAADMPLITINGQFYSLIENENSDFMDVYFNGRPIKTDEEIKAEEDTKKDTKKQNAPTEEFDSEADGAGLVTETRMVKKNVKIELTPEQIEFRDNVLKDAVKPVEEGFSDRLREAYDRFIDAVTAYFPPEKIILVRYRSQRVSLRNKRISRSYCDLNVDKFISEVDDYFYSRVKCHVIETENIFVIPGIGNKIDYSEINSVFGVENEILRIFNTSPKLKFEKTPYVIKNIRTAFTSISDYIVNFGSNKDYVKEFIEKGSISSDDIVSLPLLWNKDEDKPWLDELAAGILKNKNSYPYIFTKKLFEKNIEFLKSYEYNNIAVDAEYEDKIIVKLTQNDFFVLDKNGFSRVNYGANLITFKSKNFYNAHFHCNINEIYVALESWETYFERGRNKCSEPFVLQFKDTEEFYNSLYFIDYEEIMTNENYYLKLENEPLITSESYTPKINFDFFFDKKNRIIYQGGGFAERMFYLGYQSVRVYNKELENIYFYDMSGINDCELINDTNNIAYSIPEKYESHFIRHSLNHRLFNRFYTTIGYYDEYDGHKASAFILYKLGLKEFSTYSIQKHCKIFVKFKEHLDFECPQFIYSNKDLPLVEKRLAVDIDDTVNLLIAYCRRYRDIFNDQKADFEKIFEFPPFEEDNNKIIAEKMLSCNAVTVHIRRGDFFTAKTVEKARRENSYYKEQLERVWRIPGYDDKHLFVFSDDLDFCREHFDELGLGIAEDNITYVEGNDHFESWRDMQLMSLGKIIVISQSGFCQCAALVSKRVEYIVGEGTGSFDIFPKKQTLWHKNHPEEIIGYEAEKSDIEKIEQAVNVVQTESTEQATTVNKTEHKPNNKNTSKKHKKRKKQ